MPQPDGLVNSGVRNATGALPVEAHPDPMLLRIDSSFHTESVTRRLTGLFVEMWREKNPAGAVIERDLAAEPPTPISEAWYKATLADESSLDAQQRALLAESEALIGEIASSKVLVIGAPLYNFTLPVPLHNWIDLIMRNDKTVRMTAAGFEGLMKGKTAVVISANGGDFSSTSTLFRFNHLQPYLEQMLHFIGIDDVRFLCATNQNPFSPDRTECFERTAQQVRAVAEALRHATPQPAAKA